LAVREHDNGWSDWEQFPHIDPKTRLPYSFMSIPTEEHVALYQCGIDRIVSVDRYAALLVSMHCAGLYDRARATLPGYSAKYVKSAESTQVNEFIQQLKLQQLRLKTDLRVNPATRSLADDRLLERNARFAENPGSFISPFLFASARGRCYRRSSAGRPRRRNRLGIAEPRRQPRLAQPLPFAEGSITHQHTRAPGAKALIRRRRIFDAR
jgi:Protein of unknown function (DUF3891)